MYVELGEDAPVQGGDDQNLLLCVDREEGATIYFALREYDDRLKKHLMHKKFQGLEDQTFLSEQIAKVRKLLSDMLENDKHDLAELRRIRTWLGV
jgi:hypothetical protein